MRHIFINTPPRTPLHLYLSSPSSLPELVHSSSPFVHTSSAANRCSPFLLLLLSAAIPEPSQPGFPSGIHKQSQSLPIPEKTPRHPRRIPEKLAPTSTQQRLSLISRHLDQRLPLPELNTPFSTERNSLAPDDVEYKPIDRSIPASATKSPTMSTQPPHNTLLIPGPIEFDDAVLQSMSHYA